MPEIYLLFIGVAVSLFELVGILLGIREFRKAGEEMAKQRISFEVAANKSRRNGVEK
ncbi:hypothetical protein ACJJIW_06035 [Microbulbifer sp. JMSA004]|uniref:hypothetical protein n=1 Tax=unclassified Microbulbifer TaxID=2619833 RepID=UPI0024ADCE1D|nr:hypothetical protein [Microbulbifer sp. VAAF005]WHI44791.1 hypothetical protein P0078_13665 [Microbulbifer sp. VAAF005]